MTMTSRKVVQEAVDLYFAGKITVDEAFRRAYGGDPRARFAARLAAIAEEATAFAKRAEETGNPKAKPRRKRKK